MDEIFVSYRHKNHFFTRTLVGELRKRLDAVVYWDADVDQSIFADFILQHLRASKVVLLVVSDETFTERIQEDNDWIRYEIRTALELGKKLVLVCDEGRLPPPELPDDIKRVAEMHGIKFYPDVFPAAVDKLAEFLTKIADVRLKPTERDPDQSLAYFLPEEKGALTTHYLNYADTSETIDVVTLSMLAFLQNYGHPRIVKWVMAGKKIRVLTLDPDSAAARTRGIEERNDLPQQIRQQIQALKVGTYDTLVKRLEAGDVCLGSLEVRSYDGIPYHAYFGTDRAIILGLYYSHLKGLQSPALYINPRSSLSAELRSNFEALWAREEAGRAPEARCLCKIDATGAYFAEQGGPEARATGLD